MLLQRIPSLQVMKHLWVFLTPPQPGWEANVLVRSPGISPHFLRYPCLLQRGRDGESKAFGQLKSLAK